MNIADQEAQTLSLVQALTTAFANQQATLNALVAAVAKIPTSGGSVDVTALTTAVNDQNTTLSSILTLTQAVVGDLTPSSDATPVVATPVPDSAPSPAPAPAPSPATAS